MIITLEDQYKSLQPFVSERLNDFTIITGKNGSGKSQLLSLLEKKLKNPNDLPLCRLTVDPAILKVQYEGIAKENATTINSTAWKQQVDLHLNNFRGMRPAQKQLFSYIHEKFPDFSGGKMDEVVLLSAEEEYRRLLGVAIKESGSGHQVIPYFENILLSQMYQPASQPMMKMVKEMATVNGKKIAELGEEDFYTTPIKESIVDTDELFASRIEWIFYNYAKRREKNRRDFFYQEADGEQNNAMSDSEFLKQHTPPWDLINGILTEHKIDFQFKEIEHRKFSPETNISLKLIKQSSGIPIEFSELSSGEKIIIGLVIKMFTSVYYSEELKFPELLILDEPDAYLHPEMSHLLLEVLEDTFVKKFGIKVIFSTHSPSTIALAPESSIYQLENYPVTALKKVTKDEALKLLTSFIPTLSIDYRNHRQVFVESPTDANYYQALNDKHGQYVPLTHKLYFISNAMGRGNSDLVYNIVAQIRTSGNQTAYGIVDWDLKNKPERYVEVHGINERYSVENFLLDPIYLVTLLLGTNAKTKIAELAGLRVDEKEYDIGLKPEAEVQRIADAVFTHIGSQFGALINTEYTAIRYQNGHTIRWPKSYCTAQGHDIETKLKIVFKALEGFRNEGDLQKKLIEIMVKSYPFVPTSSIETLERLSQ